MNTQALFTVFVGIVMLGSVAGYATYSLSFTGQATQQPQEQQTIPTIVNRVLASHERAAILNAGFALFQSQYSEDCSSCATEDQTVQTFVTQYSGFAIMESVEFSSERARVFQLVGQGGQIIDLTKEEITHEGLLDLFCQVAIVQPRECLLKSFGSSGQSST